MRETIRKWGPKWAQEAGDDATTTVAVAPTKESSSGRPQPSSETPTRLPWRSVVAGWPVAWRERWGLRANALQDAGSDWRSAERIAFEEMTAED